MVGQRDRRGTHEAFLSADRLTKVERIEFGRLEHNRRSNIWMDE